MDYTQNNVDKIIGYKTWSDNKKIDTLLEMDCNMYTQLGVDSTKKEVTETKKNSRKIYNAIKKIDHTFGSSLLI